MSFTEFEMKSIETVTDAKFLEFINPDAFVLNPAPTTLETRPLEMIQAAFLLCKNIN